MWIGTALQSFAKTTIVSCYLSSRWEEISIDAVLIANVGNSDLRILGPIETPQGQVPSYEPSIRDYRYREAAERLLSLEDIPAQVEFPLMQKYLRFLELEGYRLAAVHLTATDQSDTPGVSANHISKDTYPAAELIKRWLQKRKPGSKVTIHKCSENPSDWDSMHRYFANRLGRIRLTDEIPVVPVTAGPQAMNSMLLLHAVDTFPNVRLISVSELQELPRELRLKQTIRRRDLNQRLRSHLERQDYYGAMGLLEEEKALIPNAEQHQSALALLKYAHLRTAFRFREATQEANRAMPVVYRNDHRTFLKRMVDEAARLDDELLLNPKKSQNELEALRLHEIVNLAEWYARRGELQVVLALVYSFADIAGDVALRNHEAIEAASGNKPIRIDPAWVEAHQGLQEFLAQQKIKWQARDVNPTIAASILGWLGDQGDAKAAGLAETIAKYQEVLTYRNRTPMAHGTQGVAEKDIAGRYTGGTEALLASMRRAAESLVESTPEPWMTELTRVVEELLTT